MFGFASRFGGSLVALICTCGAVADEAAPRVACPYQTAHDAPLDAIQEVVAEEAGYTKLRVEFNGIKGDRVPGFLYLPTGAAAAKRPAVLLQYGSGGHKGVDYIVALGRQFVAHGFVVLTIDSPGRGERRVKEKKSTDWLFSNEGREQFLHFLGDYSRAVDFLVARPEVDRERIGYVGISWGAITGVTYVAHDPRIKAMGSMVGGGNFLGLAGAFANGNKSTNGTNESNGNPKEPVQKPVPIDPVSHVGCIAPRPLLMLNVTKDQLVPRPFAEALHKAAGEGSKVVWLDTDHYFTGVDRDEVGESVVKFIEDHLRERRKEKP